MYREIADKCFALKAELHRPVNADAKPRLVSSTMPSIDAGQKEELTAALRWLDIDWYADRKGPEWAVLKAKNDSVLMLPRIVSDKTVPSVAGMGLKDAIN